MLTPLVAGAFAGTASAQPTVSTGTPLQVTSTGATVQITINPEGVDTLYRIDYTPAGGTQSQTDWQDGGAGTADETLTVPIDQLTPNTSYTYQAEVFQNPPNFNDITDPNTQTLTTTAAPTGPGAALIPPQNPPRSGIFSFCSTDLQCVSDANGVRAMQEGLPPFSLPSNWTNLTGNEQLFVATNIERISRGEAPIPNLVNSYDAAVLQGVQTDSDPSLAGLPGPADAIWAGAFPTRLGAMYGWLYFDGPGGANLDCTTPTAPGCWGHRDALLSDPATAVGNPTEMDAIAGTDNDGQNSYAALIVNNPNPTPPGSIVFSWADELPFLTPPHLAAPHLAAPHLAGAPPAIVTKHSQLILRPSKPQAETGGKLAPLDVPSVG